MDTDDQILQKMEKIEKYIAGLEENIKNRYSNMEEKIKELQRQINELKSVSYIMHTF